MTAVHPTVDDDDIFIANDSDKHKELENNVQKRPNSPGGYSHNSKANDHHKQESVVTEQPFAFTPTVTSFEPHSPAHSSVPPPKPHPPLAASRYNESFRLAQDNSYNSLAEIAHTNQSVVSTSVITNTPNTRMTAINPSTADEGGGFVPGSGLEALSHVDKLYLHRIGVWECDCRGGKFLIFDQSNEQLFYAREDAGCCGLCRLSVVTIFDADKQNEVMRIVRPCRCLFPYQRCFLCCYGCTCLRGCQDEIQIEAPPGYAISYVAERAYGQNMPYYEIQDAAKRPILCVGQPKRSMQCINSLRTCSISCTNTLCDLDCCHDSKMFDIFYAHLTQQAPSTRHKSNSPPAAVLTIDPDDPIGEMSKLWAFKLRCVTGNDYEITFPNDLNNRSKAALLCTAIFVNSALYWD